MTALLDLPEIRRRAAKFSVEDYHRFGEHLRAELLKGVVIEKMPQSPRHAVLTESLHDALRLAVPAGVHIRQEKPLTTSDSEPEPDLAIVRGARADYLGRHPATALLVIEVAISTIDTDRVKALIYAEAGVAEYWIVLPETKTVEVHWQPAAGEYAERLTVSAPAVIDSRALPGLSVDLAALFA